MGGLHGSNARKGRDSSNNQEVGGSYRGKRLLNGATWIGVTRASTSTEAQCWTKAAADTVNACTKGHSGQGGRSAANYNYESGADP